MPRCHLSKASTDDWFRKAEEERPKHSRFARTDTFASPTGKRRNTAAAEEKTPLVASGGTSLRTLPVSPDTFRLITNSFHTHGSIARVVSRADAPIFTCDRVSMGMMPSLG